MKFKFFACILVLALLFTSCGAPVTKQPETTPESTKSTEPAADGMLGLDDDIVILYTNDVDYQLARLLATEVITEEPFCQITQEHLQKAMQVMEKCKKVICTDVPIGECNKGLEELVLAAKKRM